MAEDKDTNVKKLPTVESDVTPEMAAAALEMQKGKQEKIIGYIISPDMLVGLLDVCEDIPGRYYKKIVPLLQNCPQLVEGDDGKVRVNQ